MAWKYRLGQRVEVDTYGVEPWVPGVIIARSSVLKDTPYVVKLDETGHQVHAHARDIREPKEAKG